MRLSDEAKKIYPIFRDREELSAGSHLSDSIKAALENSEFLIVICSPDAARAKWVNDEVTHFLRLGRENNIIPVIISGDPSGSEDDFNSPNAQCFPKALRIQHDTSQLALEHYSDVVLAADARPQGDGRGNAKLKRISAILHVPLGILKDRELEKERARKRIAYGIASIMFVLLLGAIGAGALSILSASVANERLATRQRSETRNAMERAATTGGEAGIAMLLKTLPANVEHPDRVMVAEANYELATLIDNVPLMR